MAAGFELCGEKIKRGERKQLFLKVPRLYDFTEMNIPIEVVRGKKDGPILFISAAIHGDEINGVEIIRRILKQKSLNRLKGTLIVVPIVNVFGFNTKTRYLPDRRDLNRCFPGSKNGTLAFQIAHIFTTEILDKCTHGIDLHTAAVYRANLPQIRAHLDVPEVNKMAHAFNIPVMLNSPMIEGSLRATALEKNIPLVVFEGGEVLKFNEKVIKSGVKGIISVMRSIDMLPALKTPPRIKEEDLFIAKSSHWLRAPHSGIFLSKKELGDRVKKDEVLGVVSNPFGSEKFELLAKRSGIVIGSTTIPLVNTGDAIYHIATFEDTSAVEELVDTFDEMLGSENKRFLGA